MNPYDVTKRPGAHLVAEEFGVEDPWALSDDHPPGDPRHLVGTMVGEAARDVDELHGELTRAARSAIELLEPVGRGDSAGLRGWHGILRTAGPQIELLAARRGAAYEQLTRAVSTYHRLLPESKAESASKAPFQSRRLAPKQASGRDDDWAIASGRQLAALEGLTPEGLVAAMNTALTDPAPVIRYGYDLRRLPPQATATPVKPPVPTPLDVRRVQAANTRSTVAPSLASARPFIPAPRPPSAPQIPRPGHSR